VRTVTMTRKRRTGQWCSIGQGSGSVQGGQSDDDDTGEDDESTDDGRTQNKSSDPEKKRLIAENKRRRMQARQWRQRAEAAEAKLGEGNTLSDAARADVILAMAEAGLKKDRIRAALKLVDWETVDDPEDAITDLRAEHPFLFDGTSGADDDGQGFQGRTAPAMNNSRGKLNKESDQQKAARLAKKFPALGRRF